MTPLRRIACGLAIAAATITAACAPITVTSFTQRGVDVAAYRTFAWERIDTSVPGDPRLDNNRFFHAHLRAAIERHLTARGYEPTALQPDMYVHYHASSRQKVSISEQERTVDRCRDCRIDVYDESTMLVDLTDARTGAVVWRGVSESALTDAVSNQGRMETAIERVVERMFAQLPRRS